MSTPTAAPAPIITAFRVSTKIWDGAFEAHPDSFETCGVRNQQCLIDWAAGRPKYSPMVTWVPPPRALGSPGPLATSSCSLWRHFAPLARISIPGYGVLPVSSPFRMTLRPHMARVEYCRESLLKKAEQDRKALEKAMEQDKMEIKKRDLVMLLQEGKPPKFRERWTGPFIVGEPVGRSAFQLLLLDGKPSSPHAYHVNQLKPFKPREEHLRTPKNLDLPYWRRLRRLR
ncbi:hypothetical protein GGS23DRAFT_598905 [Durotheca rogersii]|uniref:uncharacterized protein n=1 Tax=Durotheca rogersii TaxID=419775 RepID=UPI00221EF9A1|nr:uncharacterized protein GGS23DRAFT_598905 [Durotheca rogersii]KAI5861024.1 hypothetical protein GGS23DRAFT_598905 [Durotheca rogersii]